MAQFPNTSPASQVAAQAFFGNQAVTAGLTNSNGFDLTTYLCAVVGNLLASPPILTNSASVIGYTTGAGSSVSQVTLQTSAFTLNNVTGRITFASSALGSGFANASATWTCSAMTSQSVLAYSIIGGCVNPGKYKVDLTPGAGSGTIWLTNMGSTILTEAPVVEYILLQASVN